MTTAPEAIREETTDDLELLLDVLPPRVVEPLKHSSDGSHLLEVILDLGRIPQARYTDHEEKRAMNWLRAL